MTKHSATSTKKNYHLDLLLVIVAILLVTEIFKPEIILPRKILMASASIVCILLVLRNRIPKRLYYF